MPYEHFRSLTSLVLPCCALMYAFALLFACGVIPGWGRWYSASTPFREQTDALWRGDLALSHNPMDLQGDLCWSQGGVHQVWGLGGPFWRLPFEALARVFGYQAFPDRIALGLFMALAGWVILRTWFQPPLSHGSDSSAEVRFKAILAAVGAIELSLFFPPLFSLLSTRMGVYEEVMVYVYFYALILLCGVVALLRAPRWPRFYTVCTLAGLGGLVRPTLGFYGASTALASVFVMYCGERRIHPNASGGGPWRLIFARRLFTGVLLFAIGCGALFMTNRARFGDGFEFGHRLNLQEEDLIPSIYSTRFEFPFADAPAPDRAGELFGALFLVKQLNGSDFYRRDFFPAQSSIIRWRSFSFTTYDLSYASGIVLAVIAGIRVFWKWRRSRRIEGLRAGNLPESSLPVPGMLVLWGLGAIIPLALFYMWSPSIASRYMLDFAPAFVSALIGLWWCVVQLIAHNSRRLRWFGTACLLGLIAWQGFEIARSRNMSGEPMSVSYGELRLLQPTEPSQSITFPREYRLGDVEPFSDIPFNGTGWDLGSGSTKAAVELFVDNPECLILDLAADDSSKLTSFDCIQAKVGLELLQRESTAPTPTGARIIFRGPQRSVYRHGIQPVFLKMVPARDLSMDDSGIRLLKVAWHREDATAKTP